MHITWNSSKQRSHASSKISAATRGMGSYGWYFLTLYCLGIVFFTSWIFWWMSNMNSWKCTLCFFSMWHVSKNKSINMVFPVPTLPYMYRPFGPLPCLRGLSSSSFGLVLENILKWNYWAWTISFNQCTGLTADEKIRTYLGEQTVARLFWCIWWYTRVKVF